MAHAHNRSFQVRLAQNESLLLAFVCLAGFISVLTQFIGRINWKEKQDCKDLNEISLLALSGWSYFACVIFYIQLCCLWKNKQGFKDNVMGLLVIIQMLHWAAKLYGAWQCAINVILDYFFICVVSFAYILQLIIISKAKCQRIHDAHLSVFFIMLVILFMDIILEMVYHHGAANTFAGYNYFSAKVGILVFELSRDCHWHDIDVLSSDFLLFFVFLAAKLGKQVYYFAVYNKGWSAGMEQAFFVFALVELVCSSFLFYFQEPPENDDLEAPLGNHDLEAPLGNDDLEVPLGNDNLEGPPENDNLEGPLGNDNLEGPLGNDNPKESVSNPLWGLPV
jgi:hypothetical protein